MKKLPILLNVLFIIACVHSVGTIIRESMNLQSYIAYYNEYADPVTGGIIFASVMLLIATFILVLSCTFLYLLNCKTDGVSVMDKIAYGAEEAKSVVEKKRADRAEAKKQKQLKKQQKRLEELQAEIDELKKDE